MVGHVHPVTQVMVVLRESSELLAALDDTIRRYEALRTAIAPAVQRLETRTDIDPLHELQRDVMDLTEDLQPLPPETFGDVGALDRRDADITSLQCETCKEKATMYVQWLWMWLQQPAPATEEEREALAASNNPALFERTQDMLREVEQSMRLLFRQRFAVLEYDES